MRIRNRMWQVLFGTVAIVGLLGCAFPDSVQEMGFDFWNVERYQTELLEAEARSARLEIVSADARSRLSMKLEITESVIADRMTLAQATEQFFVINQTGEDLSEMVRYNFPASSLEESTAIQVVEFVRVRLNDHPPSEHDQVLSRLAREQKALQAKVTRSY